jgi:outer membrane protein TolC
MKKQVGILGFAFLLASSQIQAQQVPVMSLKDCINYSLSNSPTSSIYANQVAIAKEQNREGVSGYLPQINMTGSFDDNLKRQVTVIPAGAFGPEPTKIQFGNQYSSTANAQLDQVIYDQSLINSIKASKMNINLAGLKLEKNEDEIIYQTANAYYQVLIHQEQLKLLLENAAKMEKLVAVQKLQFEKGVLNESNYKRVLVNYNNIKSQVELTKMNVEMSLANLKNTMGMSMDEAVAISDLTSIENSIPMPKQENISITGKTDYKILETNILLQEIDLKRKRAMSLPTLSGYARYGANAFSNEFRSSFDQWYDYSAIGLKLTIPVFSGFRRVSQIKQSELTLANTKQNLEVSARMYELQLRNAQVQLNSSYINLQSNKENLELANDVYDMTALQYEKGTVGLSDFLNADYSKKEAQSNYINSLLKYLTASLEIEQSKGTIKEFANKL